MTLREWIKWALAGFPPAPTPPPPPKPLPEREPFAYGTDPLQCADVNRPPGMVEGDTAPTILVVHGGGWIGGDKSSAGDNALPHYLALGYIVILVNYRLFPAADPRTQAEDVYAALLYAQKNVAGCGRFAFIGHSAGAQLVAQVAACMAPSLPTVCLDSAALDPAQAIAMAQKSGNAEMIALYKPFGTDPERIKAASPIEQVSGKTGPWLLAYSEQRQKADEKQARNMAARIEQFGGDVTVQGFDLSHGDMGAQLGLPGPLTDAVDKFLA